MHDVVGGAKNDPTGPTLSEVIIKWSLPGKPYSKGQNW